MACSAPFCHPWVTPQAVHCPCRRRLTTCDVIHAPLGPAFPTTLHPIACASQVASHGPRHCVLLCCAGSSQSLGRCELGVFWLSVLAYRTGALPFILAVPQQPATLSMLLWDQRCPPRCIQLLALRKLLHTALGTVFCFVVQVRVSLWVDVSLEFSGCLCWRTEQVPCHSF